MSHERDDREARDRHLAWGDDAADRVWFGFLAAMFEVAEGRWSRADPIYSQGVETAAAADLQGLIAMVESRRAMHQILFGRAADAVESAGRALAASRSPDTVSTASVVLGLAGRAPQALELVSELGERFPTGTMATSVQIPAGEAAIALGQGDGARAVEALEIARRYERGSQQIVYLRGLAYLSQGAHDAAIAEFEKILAWPSSQPEWALDPFALLGIARAYTGAGRTEEARRSYQDLLELWPEADDDLPVVQQARAEYDALK